MALAERRGGLSWEGFMSSLQENNQVDENGTVCALGLGSDSVVFEHLLEYFCIAAWN